MTDRQCPIIYAVKLNGFCDIENTFRGLKDTERELSQRITDNFFQRIIILKQQLSSTGFGNFLFLSHQYPLGLEKAMTMSKLKQSLIDIKSIRVLNEKTLLFKNISGQTSILRGKATPQKINKLFPTIFNNIQKLC